MVADEIIELVGIVAVRHLVIWDLVRQILGLVDRHINICVRVRIAINENIALYRQRLELAERPFLFVFAAKDAGSRFYNIIMDIHLDLSMNDRFTFPKFSSFARSPQAAAEQPLLLAPRA